MKVDSDAHLRWVQTELAGYFSELEIPRWPSGTINELTLLNPMYQGFDLLALYAIVRRLKPRRVIELGAGHTTLVTAAAALRNRHEDIETEFFSFEPFPEKEGLQLHEVEGLAELRPIGATEVPLAEFEALGANDILFVDTTHTVKLGGDVNFLVLEVLRA